MYERANTIYRYINYGYVEILRILVNFKKYTHSQYNTKTKMGRRFAEKWVLPQRASRIALFVPFQPFTNFDAHS